ncbi:MAG: PBP1A family penicillin-binding protein [Minwuiales bacterium]|nr:PBP1A family penicillin-binding protein [Minwuiales bacterium]
MAAGKSKRGKKPAKSGSRRRGRKTAKPPRRRSLYGTLVNWGGTLLIWGGVALAVVIGYYAYDLPDVSGVGQVDRAPSVTLMSTDGAVIANFGDLYGQAVQLDDLPDHMIDAVLATEDRRFYSHFGIDVIGLVRAMWANYRSGRIVQGGSTITQQLAKNLFLTPERTIKRKVQELLLALYLESRFTKDQILSLYLNRVYLGAGAYGVEAASLRYFNRPAAEVTLQQAALLAGLLKAPSRYAPTNDLAAAQRRATQVLANMADAGMLSATKAAAAQNDPAGLARTAPKARSVRYFADWALEEVNAFLGHINRDVIVKTTLDPGLQRLGERVLSTALATDGKTVQASQGALIALSPDGAVKAMVGGRDYRQSQFNRATQARRQPGSAFKPFVYLAGLEAGLRPDDVMVDRPVDVGGWRPRNYSQRHIGPVSLQDALARSINTVAVQVSEQAGRGRVIDTAHRLGIVSQLRSHPSIALGTSEVSLIELTAAYAHFANGGRGVFPYAVVEIRDRTGAVLYKRAGSGLGRVIEPASVHEMNRMLAAVMDTGTGKTARLDRPAAGKTGTSQDFRDAWFVGYTPDLVAGVWVGNDDGSPMKRVTGGGLPAQVWRGFMLDALKGRPATPLVKGPAVAGGLSEVWQRIVDRFGAGNQDKVRPATRKEEPYPLFEEEKAGN